VSCNVVVLAHKQKQVPASEYMRMRGPHMGGAFPFPVKYGYASVGRVVMAGKNAATLVSERVLCLHPHETAYVVDQSAVRVIPSATPAPRAVLAPNLETAINVVWDARVSLGDRVCVVGGGVVGLLIAYLCARIPGTHVTVRDRQDRARECAVLGRAPTPSQDAVDDQVWSDASRASSSIRFVHVTDENDAAPSRMEDEADCDENDRDYDVVINASGRPAGLAACLELVRRPEYRRKTPAKESPHLVRATRCPPQAGTEALVVEASWHGDASCALQLGGAFHSRRLAIKSSQVGRVPPDRAPRWDYARRMALALRLCADPRLDCLLEDPPLDFGAPGFAESYARVLFPHDKAAGSTTTSSRSSCHDESRRTGLCYRIRY